MSTLSLPTSAAARPSHRFLTLMHREWLQHRRGWLVLLLAPPALLLAVLLVAGRGKLEIEPREPLAALFIAFAAVTMGLLLIGWLALFFQASGLARRDEQDRSLEFWLSMPVSHPSAIGATLLMHGLLMPLGALLLGFLCSQVLGIATVMVGFGPGALLDLPWPAVLAAELALLLRMLLGAVLATLWLSPYVMALMAASAWLKRWGGPALAATLAVGHAVLAKVYGLTFIGDTLTAIGQRARSAFVATPPAMTQIDNASDIGDALLGLPRWVASDSLEALQQLADPLLVLVLAISLGCFALLVLRRSRQA